MATYLILAAVVLICAYAVYSYIRKLRVGGGCCGEREAAPKRVKVRDRDKRHYPYVLEVTVDGMVCANCARDLLDIRPSSLAQRAYGVYRTYALGKKRVCGKLAEFAGPQVHSYYPLRAYPSFIYGSQNAYRLSAALSILIAAD